MMNSWELAMMLCEKVNNPNGRVKIRINDNNANEIIPILEKDSLNRLFRKPYGAKHVHPAEICE